MEAWRSLAYLKDLMSPAKHLFWEGTRNHGKPPPEIVISWWLLYRCFIAICKCYYVLKLQWKRFCSQKYDFWWDFGERGGSTKFSRLTIAHHIYGPRPPSRLGKDVPLPIPYSFWSFRCLGRGAFGASSLVPHFSDQSYAPATRTFNVVPLLLCHRNTYTTSDATIVLLSV